MPHALPSSWTVPDALRRRVGAAAGRQRLISEEGYLLVVLHGVPSSAEHATRRASYFLRDPSGRWQTAPKESGRGAQALRVHVEAFADQLDQLDDLLEGADGADDWFALLRDLAPLVRTTRNMTRVLEELRAAVGPDADVIAARDRAVDVERMAELLHQWATQGLDYSVARSNEEQAKLSEFMSRSGHRLNLLAAATLPLTAVGSFFGVNLASGLETAFTPTLFWLVGALSLGLGLAVRMTMPEPPPPAAKAPRGTPRRDSKPR